MRFLDLFQRSLFSDLYKEERPANPSSRYILHDGPPYANGDAHFGHSINKVCFGDSNRTVDPFDHGPVKNLFGSIK